MQTAKVLKEFESYLFARSGSVQLSENTCGTRSVS